MAKDPKIETSESGEVEISTDHENHETFEKIDLNEHAPDKAVKKSSGGLSLILSLLALIGVGYLLYQDWQSNENQGSLAQVQQLAQDSDLLSTDIEKIKGEVNQFKLQTAKINANEEQLQNLSDQFNTYQANQSDKEKNSLINADTSGNQTDMVVEKKFDNSENERALLQLQQQLTQQAKVISELQSKPVLPATNSAVAHDSSKDDNFEKIEKNTAVQVLLAADMLVNTHRIPQAINTLENYLKVSGLEGGNKRKIKRVLDQLLQVDEPDIKEIDQQLQALKSIINHLQVSTQENTEEEPQWYEKFVSVKKIETDSSLNSTAKLVAFKTELSRLLYQARLYLMLNDQDGWQSSLTEAESWVKGEMPENKSLADRIKALANQVVVAQIPSQLDIPALIDQLNGLR